MESTKPEIVFLSLGSNVGDREKNLRTAIAALPELGVKIKKVSSIYETEPVDLLEQPWFLNCVVEGETTVPPATLLRGLRELERQMGSKKLVPRGPRLIDLDILVYGERMIDLPGVAGSTSAHAFAAIRPGTARRDCAEIEALVVERNRGAVARY